MGIREEIKFRSGIAIVYDETGLYYHIDKNLKPLYDNRFDHVTTFRNGYAVATMNKRQFHINKKGKRVYFATFDECTPIRKEQGIPGLFTTVKDNGITMRLNILDLKFVGMNMPTIINIEEAEVYEIQKVTGVKIMKTSSGKYYHLDKYGDAMYNDRFDWVSDFNGGIAAVRLHGKSFHIDKFGNCPYTDRFANVELPNVNGIGRAYDEYDFEYIINFQSDAQPVRTGKRISKEERKSNKKSFRK